MNSDLSVSTYSSISHPWKVQTPAPHTYSSTADNMPNKSIIKHAYILILIEYQEQEYIKDYCGRSVEYPNTLNTCTASFTLETQSHILIQNPQCCISESKHYLPYKRLLSAISHFLLPKCQPSSLSMYAPLHAADACV